MASASGRPQFAGGGDGYTNAGNRQLVAICVRTLNLDALHLVQIDQLKGFGVNFRISFGPSLSNRLSYSVLFLVLLALYPDWHVRRRLVCGILVLLMGKCNC